MNFIQEYSLLIAVAAPVLVIVGIQLWLFFTDERGTLLLPSLRRFPSVDLSNTAIAHEPTAAASLEESAIEEKRVPARVSVEVERRVVAERRVGASPRVKSTRPIEVERLAAKVA